MVTSNKCQLWSIVIIPLQTKQHDKGLTVCLRWFWCHYIVFKSAVRGPRITVIEVELIMVTNGFASVGNNGMNELQALDDSNKRRVLMTEFP